MLTPYDEYPVHQAARPFSHIPSTDYNWDDGYYFAAMSPTHKTQLCCGLRVNPNSDMVGGYALLNIEGRQTTLRFSRCWRRDFTLKVGPFQIEFIEPLKKIRIALGENPSGISFEMYWEGTSPAVLEKHHVAENRGRRTTDQTRYSQAGKVAGWMSFRGKRTVMNEEDWYGARDHSWGLYAERPPLSPVSTLLPPRQVTGAKRGFRFWTCWRTGEFSGHYEINESSDGRQIALNDAFGVPFSGKLFRGWDQEFELDAGRHEMEYHAGSQLLKRGLIFLTDSRGQEWRQEFIPCAPPWLPITMGYSPGSWKDGGTFHTYHGSEELAMEWDEFDFANQPVPRPNYLPTGAAREDSFGFNNNTDQPVYGQEYVCRVTTYAPDGTIAIGGGQSEHVISPPYFPYGFK